MKESLKERIISIVWSMIVMGEYPTGLNNMKHLKKLVKILENNNGDDS